MKLVRAEYLVDEAMKTAMYAAGQIQNMIIGHPVKVIREWRDQPYGKSKPDLNGQTRRVIGVMVNAVNGEIQVLMEGCRTYAFLRCPDWPDSVAVKMA
jgi:hypothetical protein